MKPNEIDQGLQKYCKIKPEFITLFFNWFKKNAKREPDENDYVDFLMAIRMVQRQPDRPLAENIKSQLSAFSTAVENMDIFTKNELAKKTARRIANVNSRDRKSLGKAREHFFENPHLIRDFLIQAYDASCDIAYEEAKKKFQRNTIRRDKAKTAVQVLRESYVYFSLGDPGTGKDSPFTNLVRIAFKAIGYPCADPTRLIKECLKEPIGQVDLWDV